MERDNKRNPRKDNWRRCTRNRVPRGQEKVPSICCQKGDFVIEKVLGIGSSAMVFRAVLWGGKYGYNGRNVALKVLKERRKARLGLRGQSLDEISIQSDLCHPNIIELVGVFTFHGLTHMLLELCENDSLEDMIRARGCLTEPETRIYTIQIAGALKYLRSKNIIHRDLKPRNISLDADMNIKIGDFGLAVRLESPGDRVLSTCGTLQYMAPEVFKERGGYDNSIDLWSFGVVICDMLGGPFVSEAGQELTRKLLGYAPNRLAPDEIVEEPFIASGQYLEKLCRAYRVNTPISPSHGRVRDVALWEQHCRLAGVGRDKSGRFWPCVGTKAHRNALKGSTEGTWLPAFNGQVTKVY